MTRRTISLFCPDRDRHVAKPGWSCETCAKQPWEHGQVKTRRKGCFCRACVKARIDYERQLRKGANNDKPVEQNQPYYWEDVAHLMVGAGVRRRNG